MQNAKKNIFQSLGFRGLMLDPVCFAFRVALVCLWASLFSFRDNDLRKDFQKSFRIYSPDP